MVAMTEAMTVAKFRAAAKQALLVYPEGIIEVARLAHERFPQDKALHALVIQVREALQRKRHDAAGREQVIRLAFRRHEHKYPEDRRI